MKLVFLCDGTGSMRECLNAVKKAIMWVRTLSCLLDMEVGICVYRDYEMNENYLINALEPGDPMSLTLKNMVNGQAPISGRGADYAEASKTGLVTIRPWLDKQTYVIHFTDAPPHGMMDHRDTNSVKEEAALGKDDYDWDKLCKTITDKCGGFTTVYQYVEDHKPYEKLGKVIKVERCAKAPKILETAITAIFDMVPADVLALDTLEKRFLDDETYRDRAYIAFIDLLEDAGGGMVALTYNPVFGRLWRSICRRRDDPRSVTALNRMSQAVQSLEGEVRTQVQEWIEESYDVSGVIQAQIDECKVQWPAYVSVLEPDDLMTRKEFMEVARSCDPRVVARVVMILARVRVVHEPPANLESIVYLPREMDFFKYATHLVVPGTETGARLAGLMALFVLKSGAACPELKEDALAYLRMHKGKWLMVSRELPEAYNYNLARIVQPYPELLTDRERLFYDAIYRCGGLWTASQHKISIKTGMLLVNGIRDLDTLRDDHTDICVKCQKSRSLTVLDERLICLACTEDLRDVPDVPEGKSRMVQCRSCSCVYSVLRPAALFLTEPKCHVCRETECRERPAVQTCRTCSVSYYRVSKKAVTPEPYTCCNCELGRTFETEVSLRRLWNDNMEHVSLVLGLDRYLECGLDPFGSRSFFKQGDALEKICDKNMRVPAPNPSRDLEREKLSMTYKMRVIRNGPAVYRTMRDLVGKGKRSYSSCSICDHSSPTEFMPTGCGRKTCQPMCSSCARSWYSAKPGQVVTPNQLQCPLCRQAPTSKVLRKANRELCALKSAGPLAFAPGSWMAWCIKCYTLQPFVDKLCTDNRVPTIKGDFICETCTILETSRTSELMNGLEDAPDYKKCPGEDCGMAIHRSSGCDHVTCPRRDCGVHFCYRCCYVGDDAGDVYDHMMDSCREGRGYGTGWYA